MLFNYQYVSHGIEAFQRWLDHLVKEVWCRTEGEYSLDLLHTDLKAVIEELANDAAVEKDHLEGPIRRIDGLCRNRLSAAQRQQLALWYDANNDVEALCAGDPDKQPITYADIRAIDADLEKELKAFCTSLWTDVLDLAAVSRRIGTVDQQYREAFLAQNKEERCPYCGYRETMGSNHRFRDAYDHYLPKGTYPFNTVNFRNLAPMCDWCNSKYKLSKDPTRHLDPIRRKNNDQRRKAFYSYSTVPSGISLALTIETKNVADLQKEEIKVEISAPGREEEVEAWKDIFGIEERYKAKCCAKNDGKFWLQYVLDECANVDATPDEVLQKIERTAKASPWAEANFIKVPFLRACQRANLLSSSKNRTGRLQLRTARVDTSE